MYHTELNASNIEIGIKIYNISTSMVDSNNNVSLVTNTKRRYSPTMGDSNNNVGVITNVERLDSPVEATSTTDAAFLASPLIRTIIAASPIWHLA